MKAWLSQAGVEFQVRSVDLDLDAYRELTGRGYRTVPVTFVGETAIVGYEPAALAEALTPRPA